MIQIFLLIVIAALAILYAGVHETTKTTKTKTTNKTNEGFQDTEPSTLLVPTEGTHPHTDHPSAAVTEGAVDDDPRDIPWISSWSTADRQARRGQNCLTTYQEAGPDGTIILTTSKSCEAGMAHTRPGDRIMIPDSIPLPQREETIQHELIHIYQRRTPASWIEFYRRQWSFVFHTDPPASMPRSVKEARRSNPDTWSPKSGGPWVCWQGRYWPVPVYTDPKQPTLRGARTIWWDTWRQEILTDAPPAWRQFFGTPSQEEHPHEISAVMITSGDSSSEAGRRLLSWWNSTGRAENRVAAF